MEKPILIAEDEIQVLELMIESLEYMGYTAFGAADGEEAYKLFLTQSFGLILTNINLPKINGVELIQRIRKKDSITPIIVFTGDSLHYSKEKVLNLGADEVLYKPFGVDDLEAVVQKFSHQ